MADERNLAVRLLITARDAASGVLGALTGRVAQLGAAIATYFSARAAVGFFTSAVEQAGALEQKLTVLQQVSGASAEELGRLKTAAEEVAASPLPYTAAQAAEGQIELAKAGQSAAQVISSLPGVMSLASAAELEVADSATIVTRTLATFGLQAEDTNRVTDTLVAGANATNTSVRGIAEALSYVGPVAKAAGYDLEQTTAAVGVLSNSGIDASRAGTALVSILSQLQNPASKASKALGEMGVTSRNLNDVLEALAKGGPQAERAILAFGTEAGPGLRALVASGAAGVQGLTQELRNAGGESKAAAEAMQNNLVGSLQALDSLWTTIKTRLGEGLLGPLQREVKAVAADLQAWIASGQLEQLRAGLVGLFNAAAASVREFVGQLDLKELIARIAEFGQSAGQSLQKFAADARQVADIVSRAFAAVETVFRAVQQATELVFAAISEAATLVLRGVASVTEGLAALGAVSEQTAARWRAAAETMGEATEKLVARANAHWADATDAFERMVAAQEKGAKRSTAAAEQTTKAAKKQAEAIGLTADELDALGEGATVVAGKQVELAQATGTAATAAKAGAAATTQAADASKQAAEALRQQIAAEQAEAQTRAGATALIQQEGQARLQHIQNLQAEAKARGDATEAERLGNELATASIEVAQQVAAAKEQEAAAADALAQSLRAQAEAEGDTSTATQQAITAAEQAAQAKHLEADAADEAARHVQALSEAEQHLIEVQQQVQQNFSDNGFSGVQSLRGVQRQIQQMSLEDLPALEQSIVDCFNDGSLSTETYGQLLDQLYDKAEALKEEHAALFRGDANSDLSTLNQGTYSFTLDPNKLAQEFAQVIGPNNEVRTDAESRRQALNDYINSWVGGSRIPGLPGVMNADYQEQLVNRVVAIWEKDSSDAFGKQAKAAADAAAARQKEIDDAVEKRLAGNQQTQQPTQVSKAVAANQQSQQPTQVFRLDLTAGSCQPVSLYGDASDADALLNVLKEAKAVTA